MIELIKTIPEYDKDLSTQKIWELIETSSNSFEGKCYYKHPVVRTNTGIAPELSLFIKTHQPLIIKCLPYQLDEIQRVDEEIWTIDNKQIESPILELEDFVVRMRGKFDSDRTVRYKLRPRPILALPLISQSGFERKFGNISDDNLYVIWSNYDTSDLFQPLKQPLTDLEWSHVLSIVQGANELTKPSSKTTPPKAKTLGEAIKILDRQIALLDDVQEKAALQIPPGPQRIRGLAGTGKTVLLAMRVAKIHLLYPAKKILFTFNTKSLYRQITALILKFYRQHSNGIDPNWDKIHIRHAWGGVSTGAGVYYDLCSRQGITPLRFYDAKEIDRYNPFRACCNDVLKSSIKPEYDYIFVDEAQDFQEQFFQVLYKLSRPPHQIYWVYDELQNLHATKTPKPEDLFGTDDKGLPYVSLEGEPYPGEIEKDLVLHRSYRCPRKILMLAHAIGLGLYNKKGCIQMLDNKQSWEAIGYEIKSGQFVKGQKMVIHRPADNSPNNITDIYSGSQDVITVKSFSSRDDEDNWIAQSIQKDIEKENVAPEQIMVICLNPFEWKERLPYIQKYLWLLNIHSTIPGLIDASTYFSRTGEVTLTSIFRAKGNEAHIVYVVGFESLYDYVEAVESRNSAFTSISRSKAWVRITGVGQRMEKAENEINKILADYPRFEFIFPDMSIINKLNAVTSERRREAKEAEKLLSQLAKLNPKILAAVSGNNELDKYKNLFTEAQRENR